MRKPSGAFTRREKPQKPAPVEKHDRQDRSQLDNHFKALGFFADKTQQMTGDNQMSRGGNRKEFGQALNDAQSNRDRENFQVTSLALIQPFCFNNLSRF